MDILQEIVAFKKKEVILLKEQKTIREIEQSSMYCREGYSLKKSLMSGEKVGIISEFKRMSPSKGIINDSSTVEEVTRAYVKAGVSGLSVLTDKNFFGGEPADLMMAREHNQIPVLRKDFMIDTYQIHESKSYGADVILLIAEILTKQEVYDLSALAHDLGMEVLMEIHSLDQLEKISPHIDIIGVNNRNLKTFEVSIDNAINMFHELPNGMAKISESGIHSETELLRLKAVGYQGFLIGERFMKTKDPGKSCRLFMEGCDGTR